MAIRMMPSRLYTAFLVLLCTQLSVAFSPAIRSRPSLALSESKASLSTSTELEKEQREFVLGYLNKHHGDLLKTFAEAFSPIGSEMASANAWSGGSFVIEAATIVNINTVKIELKVQAKLREKPDRTEIVQFPLEADPVGERRRYYKTAGAVPDDPNRLPIDDVARRLCRLCWIVGKPDVTGKLIQLALQLSGAGTGKLPENMFLNQVPHNRYVRNYFYDGVNAAVLEAVVLCSEKKFTNRMKIVSQFPEMNPSMDSYRIGTILEMVRGITLKLAEQNLRVRVCVQQSMGVGIFTGVPKQLSGVSKLIQMMDWQSDEGEENEGMVGEFVRFGNVGPEHVINEERDQHGNITVHQDDAFIIIAPQVMKEGRKQTNKQTKGTLSLAYSSFFHSTRFVLTHISLLPSWTTTTTTPTTTNK
jgi:hypothetical protein